MSGTDVFSTSLKNVMNTLIDLVIPLTIFLIGATVVWLVAKLLSRSIIAVIWERAGLEKLLEQHKLKDALLGIEIRGVANLLLFLYLFFIGLILVMDISLKQISASLQIQQVLVGIMGYMSSLIQGVVILIVFLLLADLISDKIREKEHLMFKDYLAMIVQAFIAILGFVVSMPAIFPSSNVELVGNVVLVMFAGIAFGFALAFGLAFGLGAQDIVAKRLEKFIKENLENK